MKRIIIKTGIFTLGTLVVAIVAFCSFYLIKNYPRSAESFELGSGSGSEKILIATQGSEFKDQFVYKLSNKLNSPETYIKGVEVADLKTINPDDWNHIVIINSFIVKLNRRVRHFLDRVDDPSKVLLFVTAGGADWVPQADLKVDALTSSSRLEYGNNIAQLINDWIERPSDKVWEPTDYLVALRFYSQIDVASACNNIIAEREKYEGLYDNLESSINSVGYFLMRIGNIESAQKVFKMNVDLYPERANVYDSYGESLLATGEKAEAIKSYQKALELNPESESARSMLDKIS